MEQEKLKNIIEAVLLSAEKPMSVAQLDALFEIDNEKPTRDEVRKVLHELEEDYSGRAFELKQVASGFRLQVRQDYADWVGRLWEEKPARYSRALLETLALIAYRQPVTRGEIEEVRGVSVSSNIIKTCLERDWIKVLGHKDVPGKPSLYGTTREFLDYFNLKSLDELPSLAEITDLDKIHPELALHDEVDESESESENENAEVNESDDVSENIDDVVGDEVSVADNEEHQLAEDDVVETPMFDEEDVIEEIVEEKAVDTVSM